ncbi:unnamed protein product [Lota lota]
MATDVTADLFRVLRSLLVLDRLRHEGENGHVVTEWHSSSADKATGTAPSLETDLIAVINVWLFLKVFWVATSIPPSVPASAHLVALWQVLTSEALAPLCVRPRRNPSGGRKE